MTYSLAHRPHIYHRRHRILIPIISPLFRKALPCPLIQTFRSLSLHPAEDDTRISLLYLDDRLKSIQVQARVWVATTHRIRSTHLSRWTTHLYLMTRTFLRTHFHLRYTLRHPLEGEYELAGKWLGSESMASSRMIPLEYFQREAKTTMG